MNKKTCANPDCGKEFEAERVTALFCSGACKLKVYRKQAGEAKPSLGEVGPVGIPGLVGPEIVEGTFVKPNREPVTGLPKPLTTGQYTIPVTNTEGWTRPKYWMRLRDLPDSERAEFHKWLKSQKRRCPTDPFLPSSEQDFYHPWAYSAWKNPPYEDDPEQESTKPKPAWLEPLVIPKGETAKEVEERLERIKEYNSTMEPKHCLTERKLRAMLKRAGYSEKLADKVFPHKKEPKGEKVSQPTELPE